MSQSAVKALAFYGVARYPVGAMLPFHMPLCFGVWCSLLYQHFPPRWARCPATLWGVANLLEVAASSLSSATDRIGKIVLVPPYGRCRAQTPNVVFWGRPCGIWNPLSHYASQVSYHTLWTTQCFVPLSYSARDRCRGGIRTRIFLSLGLCSNQFIYRLQVSLC